MVEKNDLPSDKDQKLEKLIADYEAAREENRSLYLDGDQLADIASLYINERSFDKAQEVIDYGLKLHPGNTNLMMEQAYLYIFTMEYSKAKSIADSIAYADPTDIKILKAQIALSEDNPDEAEKLLESIEYKESLDIILDVSCLYMNMHKYEKALQWLTPSIENYQEDESFMEVITDCLQKTHQDEQALHLYDKLIDKNPYDLSNWLHLAQFYFKQLKLDKVIEASDFAIAIDENLGEPHLLKAHAFFGLGNPEKAIIEYQWALKCADTPPEFLYMFIGLAYADLENWEQALQSYDQALNTIEYESSPILTDLYSYKATSLFQLGRYEEAHQVFEIAKKEIPENVDFYLKEGLFYHQEQKYNKAKECWDAAIRYAPTADTWMQIGCYYINSDMMDDARTCFEEAQRLDPEFPVIKSYLTFINLIQQDAEGFHKYNQLMNKPLTADNIREALGCHTLPINDKDIINKLIQNIADFSKEEYDDGNDNENGDDDGKK